MDIPKAVRVGDFNVPKKLMAEGADIETQDEKERTPFSTLSQSWRHVRAS